VRLLGNDETGAFRGDKTLLDKVDVYFRESGTRKFTPRALLVDLEPGTLDVIKAQPMGKMFKPDNFVFGASGAGNNWYEYV